MHSGCQGGCCFSSSQMAHAPVKHGRFAAAQPAAAQQANQQVLHLQQQWVQGAPGHAWHDKGRGGGREWPGWLLFEMQAGLAGLDGGTPA